MKDTSNKAETSSAYALKEIGAYAMVYYQPDINLKRLLSIFGIAESNTEVIRNIMKENQIILLYGNIFHNTGSPILPGTIIKVHKKYLSSEIKKSLG